MSDPLSIFVIYENPKDFPGRFVVREWLVTGGRIAARETPAVFDTLEEARASLSPDLVPLGRSFDDDPAIREVWL